MAGGLDDERFVDDESGIPESRIEIAVRPFLRRFADRQSAFRRVREILIGPFQGLQLRARRRSAGRWRPALRWKPHVAFEPAVRSVRTEALHGIDDERPRCECVRAALYGFAGR